MAWPSQFVQLLGSGCETLEELSRTAYFCHMYCQLDLLLPLQELVGQWMSVATCLYDVRTAGTAAAVTAAALLLLLLQVQQHSSGV